jgi:6-phosphogluconolactonase
MNLVRTFADASAVSRAAARDFIELAGEAGAWERIEFFWGDERRVPPNHPEANYRMAAAALLDPLGVPRARVHRLRGETSDGAAAAREYQAEIARVFGVPETGPPPAFDRAAAGALDQVESTA